MRIRLQRLQAYLGITVTPFLYAWTLCTYLNAPFSFLESSECCLFSLNRKIYILYSICIMNTAQAERIIKYRNFYILCRHVDMGGGGGEMALILKKIHAGDFYPF
jgi:hypothetical protein